MLLLAAAQPGGDGALAAVYRIGDWPARFGIVLVVDRLSALMLLLASVLALAVLPAALARWQHRGNYFQPLFQFLLMGLNGAFLTGDLFNLFVFFEVLLAASYGLALHGSGARSEEHTSELQSLMRISYAVFCLKKKNKKLK